MDRRIQQVRSSTSQGLGTELRGLNRRTNTALGNKSESPRARQELLRSTTEKAIPTVPCLTTPRVPIRPTNHCVYYHSSGARFKFKDVCPGRRCKKPPRAPVNSAARSATFLGGGGGDDRARRRYVIDAPRSKGPGAPTRWSGTSTVCHRPSQVQRTRGTHVALRRPVAASSG